MSLTDPILDGIITNGTYFIGDYDPDFPVPLWHQRMELATVCVCNTLTFAVIVARVWYRWSKRKHFRYDDAWMVVAGFFLLPYWASQIGTIVYGGGLHDLNVPEYDREMHWHFTPGWVGYYIIASCIKLSVCFCFLEIVPYSLKRLRIATYVLCGFIAVLGLILSFTWLFQCTPVSSNFLWSVKSDYCLNYDIFRWLWIALSLPIDIIILIIPAQLLKKTTLREHERRILKLVFSATLLGTITCAIGIYGVWETRVEVQLDGFYQETMFIMMNDIEIFMYALGASFPVLSRYLVSQADPGNSRTTGISTLARRHSKFFIPNFTAVAQIRQSISRRSETNRVAPPVHSSVESLNHSSDQSGSSIVRSKNNYDMVAFESKEYKQPPRPDLESGRDMTSIDTMNWFQDSNDDLTETKGNGKA